ncbi:MAG: hypothetical protein ACFFBH_01255 [Promethearchaeota archaeon]
MENTNNIHSLIRKFDFDDLKFIIENSQDENLRVKCIIRIKNLGLRNENSFHFLERLLICDSSESIRRIAFKSLILLNSNKVVKTILHAILNESGTFLIDLIEFLFRINPFLCKHILIKKIQDIEKKTPQILFKNIHPRKLHLYQLKELLYNYQLNNSLERLYFHRHSVPIALDLYGIE